MTHQRSNATPSYYWRQLWQELVSAYAKLGLSLAQGKLPAIAGIAQEFQARINEFYLAGLWEKDLVLQLAWWRSNENQHSRAEPIEADLIAERRFGR